MNKVFWKSENESLKNIFIKYVMDLDIKVFFVEEIENDNTIIVIDESDFEMYKKSNNKIKIMIVNDIFAKQNKVYRFYNFYLHNPNYSIMNIIQKLDYVNKTELNDFNKVSANEKNMNIIMAFSPKGGVGVTTFCVSLASMYKAHNKKVLYVDLTQYQDSKVFIPKIDLSRGFGNIDVNNLTDDFDYIKLKNLIERNIQTRNDEKYNFDYISGPNYDQYSQLSNQNLHNFEKIITDLDYDVIIFDTASELSEKVIDIMFLSTSIYLLVDNTIGSAYKLLHLREFFDQSPLIDKLGIVVNKFSTSMPYSIKELEKQMDMKIKAKLKRNRFLKGDQILFEKDNRFNKQMYQLWK